MYDPERKVRINVESRVRFNFFFYVNITRNEKVQIIFSIELNLSI